MKKVGLVLIFFLCAFYFASQAGSPLKPCIKELKGEIKGNWKYNKDSSYYKTNFTFLGQLDSVYQKCLIGSSPKEIKKLFCRNRSESKEDNLIAYSIKSEPNGATGTLYFRFDNNHRLKNIYSTWSVREKSSIDNY